MEELFALLFYLVLFVVFVICPLIFYYLVGSYIEKNHYKSIKEREKILGSMPIIPSDFVDEERKVKSIKMVTGAAVISSDYFKRYIFGFITIIGGRVGVFESLMDRARREAILRMKEDAKTMQADEIVNYRIETMAICGGQGNQPMGIVEVLAYGTAIKYDKQSSA